MNGPSEPACVRSTDIGWSNTWSRFLIALIVLWEPHVALAQSSTLHHYKKSMPFRPDDYGLKTFSEKPDPLFDRAPQAIDLGVNLGVGSDCGRVNFEGTMKATLKNLLDSKYFGDVGKDIIGASPMLLTCYMSPTWCAILKHSQVSANFLSQMRLNQCALVDKYTDTRTDDYYRERQDCVRRKIAENGGNLETAMGSCQNVYQADLANWAGVSGGEKSSSNRLIESSAKWAGLTGGEADRTTDLVKAFVGDTVLARGNVSVDYGSRQKGLTPDDHLADLQTRIHSKLCQIFLKRLDDAGGRRSLSELVSRAELREITPDVTEEAIDYRTLEALYLMPELQRELACKKLSEAAALSLFTRDVSRSLNVLAVATQNPNLSPERRNELEAKRRQLKDSVDLSFELQRQRSSPLRDELVEVNRLGAQYRARYAEAALGEDHNRRHARRTDERFLDCADGVLCKTGGGP